MENQNVIASSYTHVDNGGIDVKVLNDGTVIFETFYYGYPSIQTRLNISNVNKKDFMENMEKMFSEAKEKF